MNKKLILFDLDDTLINTFHSSYHKVSYAFNKMNICEPTLEDFKSVYGKIRFPDCIMKWLSTNEELDLFLHYYEQSKIHFPYSSICDVRELCLLTKRLDKKFGIVTNTPADRLEQKMRQVALDQACFEYVYCEANKPSPKGIIEAIKHFKVEPKEVLYIGDSLEDEESSRLSSVDFWATLTGVTNRELFIKRGVSPKSIFPTIHEILKKLG